MSSSDDHPQHAKPVGRDGFVRVTDNQDGGSIDAVMIDLPRAKSAIELDVMSLFATLMRSGGAPFDFSPNPEDDLDFTIHMPDIKIDLMELVYVAGRALRTSRKAGSSLETMQGRL